jgi:hypothetical protein
VTDELTEETTVSEASENEESLKPDSESLEPVPAVELTQVRDLIIAAHPDVVPEMITGTSFDELMTSIQPARDAYQRIASQTLRPAAPPVAAQPGQRASMSADMESLSPLGKISEGLRRQTD